MALMQKPGAAPTAAEQQPTQPTQSAQPAQGGQQATDEEEQAYVQAVENGRRVLLDPKSHQQSLGVIKNARTPAEGLANLVSSVVMELDSKTNMPETVIIPTATELIDHAAELAEAAGVPMDEQTVKQANQIAVMKLLQNYGADENDVRGVMAQLPKDQMDQMMNDQQQLAGEWASRAVPQTADAGVQQPEQPGGAVPTPPGRPA